MKKINNCRQSVIALLGLLVGLLLIGSGHSATIVLNPTDDTFIDQYGPINIHGLETNLVARRGGTGFILNPLIEFDLSGIPSGTTINSAKLGLYYWHYNDGDPVNRELTAHPITSSWSEMTATWNNQPTYDPIPMAYDTVPASYDWMEWNVTAYVHAVVNLGMPGHGIEIIDPATSGSYSMIYFYSKEYGSLRPYLEIDTGMAEGWYWKPAYPNYAPSGMPDFSQRQDTWQTIFPGPNGTIESSVAGDDVYNAANNVIAPGANCQLESTPVGDDIARWSFCGPTAVANCLWWFDSKFADPAGTPGDGVDDFSLVEGYSSLDDHEPNNVPHLIEDLAGRMGTCSEGLTNIDSMQNAIDEWFIDKGLDGMFTETTYITPEFEFIEAEIERSQDVILLLGWYGLDDPVEEMDQSQELCEWCEHVGPVYWISWQEFIPIADNLSRVEVKIARTAEYPDNHYPITMTIESPLGVVLTSKTLNWNEVPELPWCQTAWISFDVPDIPLTPGQSYYIVLTSVGLSYHWCAVDWDEYLPGESNFDVYYPWDWTFRTYYEFGGEYARQSQHYVTCSGVNSDLYLIAFSDPDKDISEGSMGNPPNHSSHPGDQTVHNDALYVSHDIYSVSIGTPDPGIGYNWWLPDYQSDYEFTVVEAAVVICPTEDTCDCEPGNCNGDATINIFDITYIIGFLYLSGPAPVPYALCSGDPNCDCVINIFDVTHLISFLYLSGPPPCTCQQWLTACGPPLRK